MFKYARFKFDLISSRAKFGKFELNLALTGFIKFIVAARKFVSVKQVSADFTAVRIKKAWVWPPKYKFNNRVKFDLF